MNNSSVFFCPKRERERDRERERQRERERVFAVYQPERCNAACIHNHQRNYGLLYGGGGGCGGVNIKWRRMDLHFHAASQVMVTTARKTVLNVAVKGNVTHGGRNQFVTACSLSQYRGWVFISKEHYAEMLRVKGKC